MTDFADNRLSDAELTAEFDALFPQGFAGADVLAELAPEGLTAALDADKEPEWASFSPSEALAQEQKEQPPVA